MPFEIDKDCIMKIRKGTTGHFMIEDLPQSWIGWTARCVIKKDPYIADAKAYVNVATLIQDINGTPTIDIVITPNDSDKLPVPKGEEYASYVWGLMLTNNQDEAYNLIPIDFDEMPECRVYPEISGMN